MPGGRPAGARRRIGAREQVGEHRHGEQHVGVFDVVADASGRAFAHDTPRRRSRESRAEVGHPLVVLVLPDEVDERGRHHRLADDRLEQVVEGRAGLDGGFELVDVLVEDRDCERETIGEMAVEPALPDAGLLGDRVERALQAIGGEDLPCGGDDRAAILGAGARPAIGLAGLGSSLPTFRHGCYLTTGQGCPVWASHQLRTTSKRRKHTMSTPKTLSGDDSIKTWLEHPVGGPHHPRPARAGRPGPRRAEARAATRDQAARQAQQGPVQPGDGRPARRARGRRRGAGRRNGCLRRGARADDRVGRRRAPPCERPEWVERLDQGRFAGKTVIVTGAGSGIGRATASRIAREGGRVIAVDVSQDASTSSPPSTPAPTS